MLSCSNIADNNQLYADTGESVLLHTQRRMDKGEASDVSHGTEANFVSFGEVGALGDEDLDAAQVLCNVYVTAVEDLAMESWEMEPALFDL